MNISKGRHRSHTPTPLRHYLRAEEVLEEGTDSVRRDAWNDVIVQDHARANALAQLGDPDVRAGGRGKGHHANVRDRLQHGEGKGERKGGRTPTTVAVSQSKHLCTARGGCERRTCTLDIHDMTLEAHWLVPARYAVQCVRTRERTWTLLRKPLPPPSADTRAESLPLVGLEEVLRITSHTESRRVAQNYTQ